MKSNDIILNSQNLTVSKKNLKKSLAAIGIDITLSNSANVLAQTFGFKHEHELQENLKNTTFQQNNYELLSFYFDELLELFEVGITLIKKYQNNASDIFDCKNSGMSSFSERSVHKIYEIREVFKSNKELIIKNGVNLQYLQVVRHLFNQVTLRNLGRNNHDFYLFYQFYNYHNVEPYFLMDNVIRKENYLQPENFEHDITCYHSDYYGSFSQTKPVNRSVESYNKFSGILIKRDIYSIRCEKIDVGQSFHTHSYATINYKQSQ
jgi:hypothetical protein